MADNRTFWVRLADQTEDQATRVYVPRQGIVDDLRTAILSKFPEVLRGPTDIASLKIGDTELTDNRQSLATVPSGTVVVTIRSPQQVEVDRLTTSGWVIRNAKIYSWDRSSSFQCDLLIDTGCRATQLQIPFRKCEQLGLQEQRRSTTNQGVMVHFSPVVVELPLKSGGTICASLNPAAHPRGATPTPSSTVPTSSTFSATTTPTSSPSGPKRPAENPPEDTRPGKYPRTAVELSPVKYPVADPSKHDTILLGGGGFGAFGLDLDTKNSRLYYIDDLPLV